jgi:hypothetical protein
LQIQLSDDKIENFLAKKFRRSRSFATRRSYKVNLKRFVEFLQLKHNLDVNQLVTILQSKHKDPLEVLDEYYMYLSEYLKKNGKPYSSATVKEYVMTAKEFLNSNMLKFKQELENY